MTRRIIVGAALVIAGLLYVSGHDKAFACMKTNGCVIDTFNEDYEMKRDGRMDKAVIAGRENVEAFRAMQAGPQKRPAKR